jgi:hypothetical protein
VDFPWSMCAMMQKLRMTAGSVRPGRGAVVVMGTAGSSLLSGSEERGPILPRGFERPEISVDVPRRPFAISITDDRPDERQHDDRVPDHHPGDGAS